MRSAVALEPPHGDVEAGDPGGEVLQFIASVFDLPGRSSLTRFLPLAGDRVWSLRDGRGAVAAALLARTWRLPDGLAGVNLGYVCTRADLRRSGVGSKLVGSVAEEEMGGGACFVMAWARDHLVPFYEGLGFTRLATEAFCTVALGSSAAPAADSLPVPLESVAHAGIDALRREYPYAILRRLEAGIWRGINTGFPWAERPQVLLAGDPGEPRWYAVTAAGRDAVPTMLEYGGPPDRFGEALGSVGARFGASTLRVNLTDPGWDRMLEGMRGPDAGPAFHRLFRSELLDRGAAPVTSWLDRL